MVPVHDRSITDGPKDLKMLNFFWLHLVHRLTATLAFLIRLSPFYEDQLVPLLSVLQVGETLKGKLAEDGKLKVRKEIRALVGEVADRLCSA